MREPAQAVADHGRPPDPPSETTIRREQQERKEADEDDQRKRVEALTSVLRQGEDPSIDHP